MSLERTFQIHATAQEHSVTSQQQYKPLEFLPLTWLQAFCVLLHRNGITFRNDTSSDHVSDEMITKINTVELQLQ